jgi:hypothetical protein
METPDRRRYLAPNLHAGRRGWSGGTGNGLAQEGLSGSHFLAPDNPAKQTKSKTTNMESATRNWCAIRRQERICLQKDGGDPEKSRFPAELWWRAEGLRAEVGKSTAKLRTKDRSRNAQSQFHKGKRGARSFDHGFWVGH